MNAEAAVDPVLEASDPGTPPSRLRELEYYRTEEDREDFPVVEALAANPSTPPDVLQRLAGRFPDAFLRNPIAPLLPLERMDFLEPLSAEDLLSLLSRSAAPALLLVSLPRHGNLQVAEAARFHVSLAGEIGPEWREEASRALKGIPFDASEPLGELAELGLVPFRFVERLAGGPNGAIRRALLLDSAEPDRQELCRLFARACGSPDLGRLSAPDPTLQSPDLIRLARGGLWARCLAARHPNTPVELLQRLATQDRPLVRKWVARNPAAPHALLEELAGSDLWRIRAAVAAHARTPAEVLVRFARDWKVKVREAVARNAAAPPEALERLARDSWLSVRVAAARHPATPPAVLLRLAEDAHRVVRLSVRAHSSAPAEALKLLRGEPPRRRGERFPLRKIRKRPAQSAWRTVCCLHDVPAEVEEPVRPDAPEPAPEPVPVVSYQELLRHDLDGAGVELRLRVARDPSQPRETLEVLARHRLPRIRAAAAENPVLPVELLQRLAEDPQPYVRRRVAAHPRTPVETLVELVQRSGPETAMILMKREPAHPEVLTALADHPHDWVKIPLVEHPEVPRAALARLAESSDTRIALTVVGHPRLPGDLLWVLARHPDAAVRRAVVWHPNVSRELLAQLTGDADRSVRRAAAGRRPGARLDSLARMRAPALAEAARATHHLARLLALSHPEMAPENLRSALQSVDWRDRLAVALNPSIPAELVEHLAEDANCLVRAAARDRQAGVDVPRLDALLPGGGEGPLE